MDQQVDILERVTKALADHAGPLKQLSAEADVEYSWLLMFARGEIKNPGVIQITKLAKYFSQPKATH